MKIVKRIVRQPHLRSLLFALSAGALSGHVAQAHPYASGITNNAGTISFILNESADNVGISFPQNSSTNNLGALTAGVHTFTLGPGTNSYLIYVKKSGSGVPSQISPTPVSGGNTNVAFFGPRGVSVNKNPKGHNFGRIYVGNASGGQFLNRAVGRGLYILNADYSDALGRGTNVSPPQANFPASGAQWWGSSTTYGPYRLWVGQDDTVYVADSSGFSPATAGCPVWMMDPDVTTPIEMFMWSGAAGGTSGNAGPCQTEPVITGSLATGDLKLRCMMWNYLQVAGAGDYQSIWQYDIGSGPINSGTVWSSLPTILVTNVEPSFGSVNAVTEDLTPNPTNTYLYFSCNRSTDAVASQIIVFNGTEAVPAGTNYLWGSRDPATGGVINNGTNNDCFHLLGVQPSGIAVSPDGQYLAMGNVNAANFCIVKLTNGIPDKSTIATYTAPGVINRSVAFDAADNLYTVEGNSDSLRCYSLGLTTTCITSNDASGNNGSFSMILPSTTVSVTASTPNASQGNPTPVPGVFTITRTGQLTSPLYVSYSLGGTASNNTYTVTGAVANTNVTFAVGQSSTNITITPINDGIARLTTSVLLSLSGGSNYVVSAPLQATILIQNTAEPQVIIMPGATTMYKRYTNDYTSVSFLRLGNTNSALTLSTFAYSGTAVQNTDFAVLGPVTIPAGTITTAAIPLIRPLNPPEATWAGNKSVIVTLNNNGSTYTNLPGSNSVTLTIIDDKYPTATVLYSDPLTDPNDSTNWNAVAQNYRGTDPFGAGDVTLNFGYDLTAPTQFYGTIPYPPNGLTSVLRVTFNKGSTADSGAIDLYATNVTFSGDYAVRFQLYLAEGGEFGGVGGATITEGALFGINHDGMETNWWAGSTPTVTGPWSSDGEWFWLSADPGGATAGDYIAFTGAANTIPNSGWIHPQPMLFGSTSFANVFKDPQTFTTVGATTNAVSGLPANASDQVISTANANWADVEIKQVQNVVTLSINKTAIFSYFVTNSLFRSGTIMLGYEDPFNSLGDLDAAAYFSNLQVVRLGPPHITSITTSGANVVIQFATTDGTGSYTLQSSAAVTGPYVDVSPAAALTQDPTTGIYTFVYPQSGPARFYRIRH